MNQNFLEAGQIVNTHGIRGEVKILTWGDSPSFLGGFSTIYIDDKPVKLLSGRVHKNFLLATLEGIDDVNAAMRLKGKIVHVARSDAKLEEGRYFIADLVGLTVREEGTGRTVGTLTEVLTPPAHMIYVVQGEDGEHLIPAVDAFVREVNVPGGYLTVSLIEGM